MDSNNKEEELFTVNSLTLDPETSALSEPLTINLSFTLSRPLSGVTWRVTYILDSMGKRHAINLYEYEQK